MGLSSTANFKTTYFTETVGILGLTFECTMENGLMVGCMDLVSSSGQMGNIRREIRSKSKGWVGTFTWSDGQKYEGYWRSGKQNGIETFTDAFG
jgi:hypothetical protein